MDGNDNSQSTKKLNYHKIARSHSNTTNECTSHNNISTSPTHKAKRYANIVSPDNNQHYSSEPKEDERMSVDSFEDQVQSTVQAISEEEEPGHHLLPMKAYLDKSMKLLSTMSASIKYFSKTSSLQRKDNNKDTINVHLLSQQIAIEKERRKELEETFAQLRNKTNKTLPASLPDPDYIGKYIKFMEEKINKKKNENNHLKSLLNKANCEAFNLNSNNKKIEHFLYKEIERNKRILTSINSLSAHIIKDQGNKANSNGDYLGDEPGNNRFNEQFKLTNMSDNSQPEEQRLSDEAVDSENIRVDQMPKHNPKGVNKTSENSIDNIALKDYNSNYYSNSHLQKMTNEAIKASTYKKNNSILGNSATNKGNYIIPKRFNKKLGR